MIKFIAFVLPLLLLLQPTQSGPNNFVSFDLFGDHCTKRWWFGGCKRHVADTSDCVFWIKNRNGYGSRKGMGIYSTNSQYHSIIKLNSPLSNSEHTFVWTTCANSLWIDRMKVWTNDDRQSLVYGSDNHLGWCLSYNREPDSTYMKKYIPARRCYKMLKLGKVDREDNRVWGYNSHFRYMPGRRALTEEDVQEVRDCEAQATDVTAECQHLVKKFMDPMASDDESWSLIQPLEDMAGLFDRFVKTEDSEVDSSVMVKILMQVSSGDEKDSQKLFEKADKNGNGALDFEEFESLLGLEDEHVNMAKFQDFLRIANVSGLKKFQV